MSNTTVISVPPNHNLRNVFKLANQYPDVHIVLQPGHHTWAFNSDWEYDPDNGWYLDGPSEIASNEHLLIDHPKLKITGDVASTFPPHHIWLDPSKVTIETPFQHLHTIEYHDLDGIIYATCPNVVPADWHHVSHVEAGDLLVINDIDDPYNDESCWEYADNIPIGVKEYLEHVFTPEIYVSSIAHI